MENIPTELEISFSLTSGRNKLFSVAEEGNNLAFCAPKCLLLNINWVHKTSCPTELYTFEKQHKVRLHYVVKMHDTSFLSLSTNPQLLLTIQNNIAICLHRIKLRPNFCRYLLSPG